MKKNDRAAGLLVQILATLGVTASVSIVACSTTKGVVSPDNSPDAIKECPDDKGHFAEWPDGKQPGMSGINDVCLPKPANGKCNGYTSSCVLSRFRCGLSTGGEKVLDSLPTKNPEVCCFKVEGACAIGRPFIVDGIARLAEITHGTTWSSINRLAALEVAPSTSDDERAALAEVWTRDALTEHASVASFAQLILDLLALGAPIDLVRGAQEAMADEIRHAENAFTLASLYADTPLAPTALDTSPATATRPTLAHLAARTASEACIAETIASLHLHAAADAATTTNPTLANLLRATAEEESRHALLGYQIVRWAIERDEEARASVAAVFAEASAHVGFGAMPTTESSQLDLREHGVLSLAERQAIANQALIEIIAPLRRSLAGFDPRPTRLERSSLHAQDSTRA